MAIVGVRGVGGYTEGTPLQALSLVGNNMAISRLSWETPPFKQSNLTPAASTSVTGGGSKMSKCQMLIVFAIAMVLLTVEVVLVEGKVVLPGVGVEAGCAGGEVSWQSFVD